MSNNSSAAKDGGANQSKTTMPPVSAEYRDNYTAIFGKSKLEILAEQELEREISAEKKYKEDSRANDFLKEIF